MVLFWHPRLDKFLGKERARMKNRKLNAVLTRFGIIAAILATLVLIAPVVSAADPIEIDYAENETDAVLMFSATDADGDAIEWGFDRKRRMADFDIDWWRALL